MGCVGAVAWLVGLLGVPASCLAGLAQARSRWVLHAARRDDAARSAEVDALSRRCDCFASDLMDGSRATAYASRHLVADPEPVDPVAAGAGLRLLSCPTSRIRWLEVTLAPEGATVLLRASADALVPPTTEPLSDTRPGMYL
jgi:hypothetical protein